MAKRKIKRYEAPAIDELRRMVNYFNCLHESFNTAFTHEQLFKIWKFTYSEQGGNVHECADHWSGELLDAVLKAKVGEKLPVDVFKRAYEAAS